MYAATEATFSTGKHPRQDEPGQVDQGQDVHTDQVELRALGGLGERAAHGEPGVVHQGVDLQAHPLDPLEDRPGRARLGEVGGDRAGRHAVRPGQLVAQAREPVLASGDQHEVEPARGEPPGQMLADAARRTGDQRGAPPSGGLMLGHGVVAPMRGRRAQPSARVSSLRLIIWPRARRCY
jgi:hypothetical protein